MDARACVWKQGKMNEWAGHYLCDTLYIPSIHNAWPKAIFPFTLITQQKQLPHRLCQIQNLDVSKGGSERILK